MVGNEVLSDGLPRFFLVSVVRLSHTADVAPGATFQVCGNCGKNLRAYWATVLDRTTNMEVVLGSECVKAVVGESIMALKRAKSAREQAEIEDLENLEIQSRIKRFEMANKDIVDHLRNRVAQEKKIYDDKRAAFKLTDGNCPVYRGEFFESLLEQIGKQGTLTDKQMDVVREDMTRNRSVALVVGTKKFKINGVVTKAVYECSMYGGCAKLVVRENGVDFILKIKGNSAIAKRIGIVVNEKQEKIYNVPGELMTEGTIKWVDPAGGKAVLIRCK